MQGDLSQNAFAKQIGIHQSHLSNFYSGKADPGDEFCKKLGLQRIVMYRKVSKR